MDSRKKRNKKKKGNQAKNADDTASNTEEVVSQEPTNESVNLQPTQNGQVSVNTDSQNVAVSESDMELDKHKNYEAKLEKLHETVTKLEDEKNFWHQKVFILEEQLEKLQDRVSSSVQNEASLEGKLHNLQNEYDSLANKAATLEGEVKSMGEVKDSWPIKEASLKEAIAGLEEANWVMQVQVKELEQSKISTDQENKRLIETVSLLESRIESLEAKSVSHENLAADVAKLMEGKIMTHPTDLIKTSELVLDQQGAELTDPQLKINETNTGAEQISQNDPDRDITVSIDFTPIRDSQANGEMLPINGESIEGMNTTQQVQKQVLEEARVSEEIVPVPLDEIEINNEEESNQTINAEINEGVPLSDAPLIGAPFRLFSFMAKYVSGADLVDKSSHKSGR